MGWPLDQDNSQLMPRQVYGAERITTSTQSAGEWQDRQGPNKGPETEQSMESSKIQKVTKI